MVTESARVDAGEQMAVALGEEGRPAPGGIDMKMAAEFAGQIGHRLQGIDIAGFGGAGDTDQRQRADILVPQAAAFFLQPLQIDAVALVGLDHHQVVAADAEQIGRLAEGVVPAPGDQHGDIVAAEMLQGAGQPFAGRCRGNVRTGRRGGCAPPTGR